MTPQAGKAPPFRSTRLRDLRAELGGVERFLHQLRHRRGRWHRKWVKGMLAHYEDREARIRAQISHEIRKVRKDPKP